MNRLALVLAISLAASMTFAASAMAGPNGELHRSQKASKHGSAAPAADPRAKPKGNPQSSVPAKPAPVKKPSTSPTASKSAGHGANVSGPYDPSGVGKPSQNGKGTGGGGRPCAGCVGKADGKNPPGQMPGGSDHNAGYECDRNEGIGKTNPAHSGCGEQSSAGPFESSAAEAIARAAALELAKSGTGPALVPTAAGAAEVLGREQSGGPAAAGPGQGAQVIPAADRSPVADMSLPTTGLALGLLALLGVAIAGLGLLLRRAVGVAPSAG